MQVERNSRKILARLRSEGWVEAGATGSHHKLKHPVTSQLIVVPLPRKTCRSAQHAKSPRPPDGCEARHEDLLWTGSPGQRQRLWHHVSGCSRLLLRCRRRSRPADECTGGPVALRRRLIRSTDTDDRRLLRDKNVATEIAGGAFVSPYRSSKSPQSAIYLMLDEDLVASVDRVAKVWGQSF